MRSLLSALRLEWLPIGTTRGVAIDPRELNPPLDLRCRYALEFELDADESILSLCSLPQMYKRMHACFIPGRRLSFTSCLVLTNRRIMTIASRIGYANDRGEITIRYAAGCDAVGAEIERHDDGFRLSLKLRNGRVWNLCLANSQAASANKLLELLRPDSFPAERGRLNTGRSGVSNAVRQENLHG
jgi:hypothetical protein